MTANHRYKILIVDDSVQNLELLANILSHQYETFTANSGVKALKNASSQKPDLILLDVMMPIMDGFKTCQKLKEQPETQHIPVIFITAKNETEDELTGLKVGGADFIVKPFRAAIVQERVKNQLAEIKLREINRAYEALNHVNTIILKHQDEHEFLQETCKILIKTCQYGASWIGLHQGDRFKKVSQCGVNEEFFTLICDIDCQCDHSKGCPTLQAFRTKEPVIFQDIRRENFDFWRDETLKCGYLSTAAIPMIFNDEVLGVISVYASHTNAFSEEEVSLLNKLAQSVSFGITTIRERRLKEKAFEELKLAANVYQATSEGVIITDECTRILSINPAFTAITGYTKEDLLGRTPQILKSNRHEPDFYREIWEDITVTGHWKGEIWNRKKSGELYVQRQTINAVKDSKGEVSYYVSVFYDITNIKQQEEQIRHLAYHDPLTKLPNRFLLQDRISHAIERAKRDQYQNALFFLDLDRFKQINDTLGHNIGDQLLCVVAERISSSIRKEDTLARLGGDEFVVLLEEVNSDNIVLIAHKIIDAINQPMELSGHSIQLSASIGIAMYPDDGTDVIELMKNADTAMYASKNAGRNQYSFFDAEMNERAGQKLKMEMELKRAFENKELELHFQPLMNIEKNEPYGFEALIRWRKDGKMITPDTFLPIARECGLMEKIDTWVLEHAFQKLQEWKDEGLPPYKINVNISAFQFKNEQIVRYIQDLSKTYGIPTEQIVLELTEDTIMENPQKATEVIQSLKEAGIKVALDDFGTGYSSLSYLRQMPFDAVKIDKSFIMDCPTNQDSIELVNAIIAMSKALRMAIVAEGVETVEQLDILKKLECSNVQGFLFSKPLEQSKLFQWLDNFIQK